MEKGIAVLNAAAYAAGVLAKGSAEYPRYVYNEASEKALEPVRRVEAVCLKYDIPPGGRGAPIFAARRANFLNNLWNQPRRTSPANLRLGAVYDP